MKRFFKIKWLILLLVLVGVAYFFYQRQASQASKLQEEGYVVKKDTLEEILSLSGEIDAHERVNLKFQSGGLLSWVGVKEGDYVKSNQGIAALDQRDVKMRLKKYLNTYAKTRLDFDQTKYDNRDVNIGGLSKDLQNKAIRSIEKAQYDLNNTVLDVELQNLAAQYSYLSTPIDGIVVHVSTPYPGVNITAAEATFDIINPESVYFSATADQTDVWKLASGMKGNIALDPYPESTISGVIKSVAFIPKTDESGTVYEVEVALEGENNGLMYKLGMTGDISFTMRKKDNVIYVPTRYIKVEDDKKNVLVIKNGKSEKREVKTGAVFDSDTEIISGLSEGEIVIE